MITNKNLTLKMNSNESILYLNNSYFNKQYNIKTNSNYKNYILGAIFLIIILLTIYIMHLLKKRRLKLLQKQQHDLIQMQETEFELSDQEHQQQQQRQHQRQQQQIGLINSNNSNAPVVVTSSTHTPANTGVNYPVDEPIRGYQSTQPPYTANTTPYPMPQPTPVHTGVPYPINDGMPMPQAHGQYQAPQTGYQAPYPPAQNPQDVLPPSYDQVVGGSTGAPTTTPYNKQSPYNPHYAGN